MAVMGVAKFERFFRAAARLHVDKNDLKRYNDFVHQKLYDLLIMAQATARANDRGIIMPFDLPVTQGLQQSIHRFEKLDVEIEVEPILQHLATLPLWTCWSTTRPRLSCLWWPAASAWRWPRPSRLSTQTQTTPPPLCGKERSRSSIS